MANNRVRAFGRQLNLAITFPAAPASGDPVLFGGLPGVALQPKDANGLCVVDTEGVYNLPVSGVVAAGDQIQATQASPVVLSSAGPAGPITAGQIRFGYAIVAQAGTGVIPVKLGYGG